MAEGFVSDKGGFDNDPGDSASASGGSGGDSGGGAKAALQGAGKSLTDKGQKMMAQAVENLVSQNPGVKSYRKGGRVKKTGLIHAHRNEEVVRPEDADKVRKFLKKNKGRAGKHGDEDRIDDMKKSARKGDPKLLGKKEEPDRTAKKNDPKQVFRHNSPKKTLAKRKAKRMKNRGF